MAESKQERMERVSKKAVGMVDDANEEVRNQALEAREEADLTPETDEEAAERVSVVRRTMMFGDMPTDPTTGDPQVPVSKQEEATVSVAESDAAAEMGDEEAQDQSLEEAARQKTEGLDEEESAEADDSEPATDEGGMPTGGHEGDDKKSAQELVAEIKDADSADKVDELVGDDNRVSVQRAAEARKKELEG